MTTDHAGARQKILHALAIRMCEIVDQWDDNRVAVGDELADKLDEAIPLVRALRELDAKDEAGHPWKHPHRRKFRDAKTKK